MSSSVVTFEPVGLYTLRRNIPAICLAENDETPVGLSTELPAYTEIEVYGPGFKDATVQVRCQDQMYFVFREDLDL